MERVGWRKQWRKQWDSPTLRGRPNHLLVWMWLLDHVMFAPGERVRFGGDIIELMPGQMTCGSIQISKDTGVSPSTVRRVLSELANEQQIEQRHDNKCSLITVINWGLYQSDEQHDGQQMSSKRAADEQQMSTKEEGKKVRKKEAKPIRPETESLYEWIDSKCSQIGIENKVARNALDVSVERYLLKIQMRVELDGYFVWMLDKKKRVLTSAAVNNCFKRAHEFAKKKELKHLEWIQAQKDPGLAARLKASGEKKPDDIPKVESFAIDPALRAKLFPTQNA